MVTPLDLLVRITLSAVGLLQVIGTTSGFHVWLDWQWPICWFMAILIGWTPGVGTWLGAYGAHAGWNWSFPAALLLFAGLPAAALLLKGALKALAKRRPA